METNFSSSELIKKGMSGTPTDQKVGKFLIGTILVGISLAILYKVLPYIVPIFDSIESIAESTLRIGIYALIGVILFMFFKAQWRNIGYLNDAIARRIFKGIITYDPFLIQEKQILQAEQDVESMMREKAVIEGKYTELSTKLKSYQKKYLDAKEAENISIQNLRSTTDPKKMTIFKLDADDCARKQIACKNYIDTISPIANDMKFIIDFTSEGYQILKRKIAGAKQDLIINKDIFESANAGAAALEKMKRAMVGDIQLNNDAERAQLAVMQNIALTVGQMKASMEIISDVTRQSNLEDAGKLAVARKQLEALNLTSGQAIPLPEATANFNTTFQLKDMQMDYLPKNRQLPD